MTFPDGTRFRLEEVVPEETLAGSSWISNHDRAGFYTTRIWDLYGNQINIEYWGAGYPFPEAIKKISSNTPAYSDMKLETTLCSDPDPEPSRCPPGAAGLLKEVRATGFKGVRVSPQETIYKFSYHTVEVTDSEGTHILPVLAEVRLSGSDGAEGGSVRYSYGTGVSLGIAVETFGPLLDRITYPLGAVSEYRYGQWTSGNRCSRVLWPRQLVGIVKRTLYSEGLNADDSISGKPHATWSWTRQFQRVEGCEPGPSSCLVNNYEQLGPDGSRITFEVFGDPCGTTDPERGPFGVRKSTTIYVGQPGVALREQILTYDWLTEVDGEIVKTLGQTIETIYRDDTGVCFESSGTSVKSTKVTFRHRDSWSHWGMVIQGGDAYMPLLDGTPISRVTYTRYLAPSSKPCWDQNHIVGKWDQRYVEEGKGALRRYEENYDFDCQGDLANVVVHNEWLPATTDPGAAEPRDPNRPTDPNDVHQAFTYDAAGNLSQVSWSGGHGYPDGSPTNSYSRTLEWDRGIQVAEQYGGVSYRTLDRTADPGGQVAASRDPNGLETRFDYDALGRIVEIDPPGDREHKIRFIYPDLRHVRRIQSSGTERDFDSARGDQIYEEVEFDGLGRAIQTWRAMPGGQKSTQIARYDQLGRLIFVSEWMAEDEYQSGPKLEWDSGDLDGDGIVDYFVGGIPLRDGRPWGTVTFFGTPNAGDPGNPLRVQPDGAGRVHRVERADGFAVDYRYCGPHVERAIKDVRTSLTDPQYQDSVTRFYFDALGRLVLVDAPPSSADAEYRYDPRGNLEKVNLVEQLPPNAYEAWRQGTIPQGQVREFRYDASGRLAWARNPEKGRQATGQLDVNGNASSAWYDAIGNLLVYQDELALTRGYFFRNTYDSAGRLRTIEKISGDVFSPQTTDVNRLGSDGGFEEGMGSWEEGTIRGDAFTPGDSMWRRVMYGSPSCLSAPPGNSSNSAGLYFGDASTCSYGNAPATAQAVRHWASGVTRDDVLSLKFWRQVREGSGDRDAFLVYVVAAAQGDGDVRARRIALRLDESQASFARWQRTYEIRPADLFTPEEWAEGATKDLYLYIVFEKGDTEQAGIGTGVPIDDVFLGRRGTEILADYRYDMDTCAGTSPEAGEACLDAEEQVNRFKGKLAQVLTYQDTLLVAKQTFAYQGLNGRLSGVRHFVDWAGAGQPDEWVSRFMYDEKGLVSSWIAPYQPGKDSARRYEYRYNRGYLDGLFDSSGVEFLKPGASPPALGYTPAGSLESVRFKNGTTTDYARDKMDRPFSITVTGPAPGGGGQTLWSTGAYAYDGANNISAIGSQQFAYDLSLRLKEAKVSPQASNPSDTVPYDISYSYDVYGNMTQRTWAHNAGESPPVGFPLNFGYSAGTNQIQDPNYTYDPNGNLTRYESSGAGPLAAFWDALGRLTGVYTGRPEEQGIPAERYRYDASRLRLVRVPEGGDGRPIIALRGGPGGALSEFVVDPAVGRPKLAREYLYASGLLLVERKTVETFPTMTSNSPMASSNSFGFDLQGSPGFGSYIADIRTADGYANRVTAISPDVNGVFWLPESAFAAGKSNWVRVRKESGDAEPYSNAVTVAYDPSVTAESPNRVRAVSVTRNGTQVIVRWSVLQPSTKKTKVYFTRKDTGITALLTPQGLAPGVTELVLDAQALGAPCGSFSMTQTNLDGSGETGHSVGSELPTAGGTQYLEPQQPGCGGQTPPPSSGYSFADTYHHRDHLGSLRIVTDTGGWQIRAHDYYPFGREILPPGADAVGGSSRRYAGHERDLSVDLDYMVMRYKPVNLGCFSTPDLIYDASLGSPDTWNLYSYVHDNPVNRKDPTGLRWELWASCTWHDGKYDCGEEVVIVEGFAPRDPLVDRFVIISAGLGDWGGFLLCVDRFCWVPQGPPIEVPRGRSGEGGGKDRAQARKQCAEFLKGVASLFLPVPTAGSIAVGGQGVGSVVGVSGQGSLQVGLTSQGEIFGLVTLGGGRGGVLGVDLGGSPAGSARAMFKS